MKSNFQTMWQSSNINKKYIIIALILILCAMLISVAIRSMPQNISLKEYETFLQKGQISKAELDNERIIIRADGKNYFLLSASVDIKELARAVPIGIKSDFGTDLVLLGLICGLVVGFVIYKGRKKEKLKTSAELNAMVLGSEITPTISNVAFDDVAGIDDVKFELMEIVDFLKNPRKYKDFGVKLPRGVLMIGPPGVGKTLVAKAVAGEANVPFFYQSGASFVQIYVGMGAKRVRELFSKAKTYAPSIIFIDEIDAVGKARGGGRNDEREATLNQLLTEMDGFNDNSGVIVIAATNKIEMIDEALLRSGRFDRRIYLALPDLQDRIAILHTYLDKKSHNADINAIARHTTGFSGAALATLVNEAAINALRNKQKQITNDDFKAVFLKVLHGKRKIYTLSSNEKQIQALYKAAKALIAEWFSVEFDKISLLEDRFIQSDSFLESKTALMAKIKVYLAGMAAMRVYQNEFYTNCAADLAMARELAQNAVSAYAMGQNILPREQDIDEILTTCLKESEDLFKNIKDPLFALRDYLVENENVSKAQVAEFLAKRYE